MKTLRILSLLIVAAFMFSCEKDVEKDQVKQDVVFGITHLDSNELKSDDVVECPDDIYPVYAEIVIRDDQGLPTTYNPVVFYLNGLLYTQAIKLESGDYVVEKFIIYNSADIPIMATPNAGSDYEVYVTQTVEFDITVGEFTKVEVPVEVLCFVPGAYDKFGFFWFNIEEIIIKNVCFFGDICYKQEAFTGSLYETIFGFDDYPFDIPALIRVETYVFDEDEEDNWKFLREFENYDNNQWIEKPMCAEYFVKKNGDVDTFKFKMYVWVPTPNGFQWVLYETFIFDNDDITVGADAFKFNSQDVVEFVIGYCTLIPEDYEGYVYQYLPIENLPEIITVTYADGTLGYFDLTLVLPAGTWDLQAGSNVGWCGDENTFITLGTYNNVYVHSTLTNENWPAGPWPNNWTKDTYFTKITKANWLISHLGMFDGFNTPTGMYITSDDITQAQGDIIQDAIWGIMHDKNNLPGVAGQMVSAANSYGENFVPMPGQWTAVLFLINNSPELAQMTFIMIDP